MANDTIMRQQLKQCENKIANLKFQIAVEEQVLSRLRQIAGQQTPTTARPEPDALFGDSVQRKLPAHVRRDSLPSQIAAVLQEKGRRMRGCDIAKELVSRGVRPSGKTSMLALVLSALRKRKDLFRKVSRGTYVLIE